MAQIWTWRSWVAFGVALCGGCGSSVDGGGALALDGSDVTGGISVGGSAGSGSGAPTAPGDGVAGSSQEPPQAAAGATSVPASAGSGGATTPPAEDDGAVRPLLPNGYVDLSPPRGAPFDLDGGAALTPPPPAGFRWYPVEGSRCRDGSEAGLFIRFEDSKRLMIYFEGGGACTSPGFCNFNPQSVNHVLSGTGETVLGSALGAVVGRQQPGVYQNGELTGIFSSEREDNPFSDWNLVYVPYCTGDVHAGTNPAALVPGVAAPQQFVGHHNTALFVGRLAATFGDGLERLVVAGSSAGSFGAALSFSMISDAFPGVQADALLDSGAPFDDAHWPPCLQRSWRDLFGLDAALPPDCPQCFATDGGGLLGLADFLIDKHPSSRIAIVSSTEDEVIRLFFTPGENACANVDAADPVQITLGQLAGQALYPAQRYAEALLALRSRYASTGRLATYFFAGVSANLHQHAWRPRFFEPLAGSTTLARFVSDFLEGRPAQVGP